MILTEKELKNIQEAIMGLDLDLDRNEDKISVDMEFEANNTNYVLFVDGRAQIDITESVQSYIYPAFEINRKVFIFLEETAVHLESGEGIDNIDMVSINKTICDNIAEYYK